MTTILDNIIEQKKRDLLLRKERTPEKELQKMPGFSRRTVSLTGALLDPERTGIIAEFKRKSPSKGIINATATIEEVTTGYFRAGASALSVLTDNPFFGGTDADLIRAREINPVPILRKDFIIDEYQVIESKALGADAILLIAAVLDETRVRKLAGLAQSLNLQVILEVHETSELAMAHECISVIGVNNRDLRDFTVDINRSLTIVQQIPKAFVKISESGIHSVAIINQLRSCGFDGFLIGENFMREPDPATAFSAFVKQLIPYP
jgi:indole-3-glycerol phosphate synthase